MCCADIYVASQHQARHKAASSHPSQIHSRRDSRLQAQHTSPYSDSLNSGRRGQDIGLSGGVGRSGGGSTSPGVDRCRASEPSSSTLSLPEPLNSSRHHVSSTSTSVMQSQSSSGVHGVVESKMVPIILSVSPRNRDADSRATDAATNFTTPNTRRVPLVVTRVVNNSSSSVSAACEARSGAAGGNVKGGNSSIQQVSLQVRNKTSPPGTVATGAGGRARRGRGEAVERPSQPRVRTRDVGRQRSHSCGPPRQIYHTSLTAIPESPPSNSPRLDEERFGPFCSRPPSYPPPLTPPSPRSNSGASPRSSPRRHAAAMLDVLQDGDLDLQALRREVRVLQVQVDELREQEVIKEQQLLRLLHEHHVRTQALLGQRLIEQENAVQRSLAAHVRHVGTLAASDSAQHDSNCAARCMQHACHIS